MKSYFVFIIIAFFFSTSGFSQVAEDFADGNFSASPVWNGDNTNWTVINGQMRSNSALANSSFYLSTPSSLLTATQWEFYVKLAFNTSGTNYVDVFLTADAENLKTAQNGYFIRIGGTRDEISLYKKVAGVSVILINGTDGITNTSSNTIKIKVTCQENHQWTLERDVAGTGAAFTTEGTVTDAAITTGQFFGVLVQQSTSGFFNKHFFDDFLITPLDVTPPGVTNVQVTSANSLEITFNEMLHQASAENTANYSVNHGMGSPVSAILSGGNKVLIQYQDEFISRQAYELTVSSVEDVNKNAIVVPEVHTFTYIAPFSPQFRDIVINEIFADPSPPVDLPEAEFVELYNTTDENINLSGYAFTDGASIATFGNIQMAPKSYLIICNTVNAAFFAPFGNVTGLPGFPSLNNSGETLTFKNASGKVIDKITYATAWYKDGVKDDGGWSLEQINPVAGCNNGQNWIASNDDAGGTPGKQNSVYDLAPDTSAPILQSIQINAASALFLNFSEPMDSLQLKDIRAYTADKGMQVTAAKPLFPDYTSVQLTMNQQPEPGQVYTLTVKDLSDCTGNKISTTNMTFGVGATPQPFEILITEILADETPAISLPEAEFIEVFNASGKLLSLDSLTFSDGNGTVKLSGGLLSAGEYVMLCSSGAVALYKPYGRAIAVPGFSLNNSGEPLKLTNIQGKQVHMVTFNSAWYQDAEKSNGGWSLEMINTTNTCAAVGNWRTSVNQSGGTPGRQNSIYSLLPDLTVPVLQSVSVTGANQLMLSFSESMDSLIVKNITAYMIDNGILVRAALPVSPDFTTVQVSLSKNIEPGTLYNINVSSLTDCPGNPMQTTTLPFGIGDVPQKYELLITEILADESPVTGLPEAEYIEVYNPTNKLLSLDNLSFSDGTGAIKLKAGLIKPNERILLCASAAMPLLSVYGRCVAVSNFSLNNSGELLQLINPEGKLIHAVEYSPDWYRDPQKANGGWSLEMIDLTNPCEDEQNWAVSEDTNGGTPGKINSINASRPDLSPPIHFGVTVLDSLHLRLSFEEKVDSLTGSLTNIYLLEGITVSSANVKNPLFREVELQLASPLLKKVIYTLSVRNIKDCNGNISSTLVSTPFTLPEQGDSMDVIINEVLFNPRTGGVDFVEMHNRSAKYINLQHWHLANFEDDTVSNLKPLTESAFILPPQGYLILTTSKQNIKGNYPKAIEDNFLVMKSLPTFADNVGNVLLLNNTGKTVDRFDYTEDFHFSLIDDTEGISLERINPDGISNTSNNWHSAASAEGYATPGYRNSQYMVTPSPTSAFQIVPKVFTPDEDGWNDFTTLNYRFSSQGNTATITIFDGQGREVKKIARNELLAIEGFYSWDGTNEQGLKVRTGSYIVHFTLFDMKGKRQVFKERVVVGSKF